jgi:hypothetical protein
VVRSLLIRGMLVGAVGAVLAFAFAWVFGEPSINFAIAVEEAHAPAGPAEPEVVSRTVQSTLGLGVAFLLYGSAFGGLFALAFAFAYGRVGALAARPTSVLVAVVAFVAVYLVPFLKYPPNPPAVGNPDTIGRRSMLYVLLVLVCVLAAIGALLIGRNALPRLGGWDATLVAVGAFVLVAAVAGAVFPGVDEVAEFPASALWRFRLASLGTQAVLWTTLGLLFGALTDLSARRVVAGRRDRSAAPAVPTG